MYVSAILCIVDPLYAHHEQTASLARELENRANEWGSLSNARPFP